MLSRTFLYFLIVQVLVSITCAFVPGAGNGIKFSLKVSGSRIVPRMASIDEIPDVEVGGMSIPEFFKASDVVIDIPTYLPSDRGIDYVPLATMLATGDFLGADQFTRDHLIKLAGSEDEGRAFVYFTEVQKIPSTDLATIERLWLEFSKGNFGYSVQKRVWDVENQNFDKFIKRIGWTKIDNGIVRKLRWFGTNEFIYDIEKAPKGHLPLTSALRGTQLLKSLMNHPVWDQYDWKNYQSLKWNP